ncbi:MAG: phosphatidylserine decarboxylase [Campylobacterales bacterium]|nr:phosphatidylserine decarboxylase [Campylobacterales bacterium]
MKPHYTSLLSRWFGVFAATHFPKPLQTLINRAYVWAFKLDMGDFLAPSAYVSLTRLFTRSLVRPRHLEGDKGCYISPCDAKVSACGHIAHGMALQIKGMEYSVGKLLGEYVPKHYAKALEGGEFFNLYLSPRDYHRYHAPCHMKVLEAHHIPGKLYPVNFTWLKKQPRLFCENERVVLVCEDAFGERFYMVFVGALNVGKMRFEFDERIQTNAKEATHTFYMYEGLWLEKGAELGFFEMGSTIVLLFENPHLALGKFEGQQVRFGELLACR